MDCQSGYSYHQQDKQVIGGCLRNREGQAAVQIIINVFKKRVCAHISGITNAKLFPNYSNLITLFLTKLINCN